MSLILQAHLGSVHEPSGPDFNKHLARYHTDTFVIFSHANRLIRCIIDCQLFLKDATSAKNALELARGLAAKAWDNTPNVLKQIQGIGDVSMRKLAAKGIKSMDTLSAADPQRIDLLLGKQQPYGHNLLKTLSAFPNLRISIKEMGRKVQNGSGVTLKLKCEVGFLNETAPTRFEGTFIYVCFLLEDSNGTMIDFRRFSATKLKNGEDILLTAVLTQPTSHIRAHVMCDEVAGTSKYGELQLHDIPASVYPKAVKPAPRNRSSGVADDSQDQTSAGRDAGDAFEDDGVDDNELLAAANTAATIEVVQDIDDLMEEEKWSNASRRLPKTFKQSTPRSSVEADEDEDQPGFTEPTQLENGRWKCQHLCKQKGIDCKHKCCLEGVAKPKRRPKNVTKSKDSNVKQQKFTGMNAVSKSNTTSSKYKTANLDDLAWSIAPKRQDRQPESGIASANTSKKRKLSSVDDVGDHEVQSKRHTTRNSTPNAFDADWGLGSLDTDMEDIDAELWEPEDCDWNLPPSYQPDTSMSGLPNFATTTAGNLTEAAAEGVNQSLPEPSPERPGHVAMADVQMKPDKPFFVTGQSSSPLKPTQPKVAGRVEHSSDDFFGTPLDTDDFDSGEAGADADDGESGTPTAPSIDKPGELLSKESVKETKNSSDQNENETEEEKKKRLWEEDQMRRWSQLEPWMYEMFGSFTEIVD